MAERLELTSLPDKPPQPEAAHCTLEPLEQGNGQSDDGGYLQEAPDGAVTRKQTAGSRKGVHVFPRIWKDGDGTWRQDHAYCVDVKAPGASPRRRSVCRQHHSIRYCPRYLLFDGSGDLGQ